MLALVQLAGCSVLVNPDLDRLGGGGGDVARVDSTMIDDRVAVDVPVVDGVTEDRPPPPDVIRVDVPVDVPPACPAGCNDGIACTVDRCNTALARCESMPDNTMCPAGMICDSRTGCMMRPCGSSAECDDRDMCNGTEQCTMGRCVGSAPLRCDDGQFCNGTETCDPARGCVPSAAPTCDDMTPCTLDRCNFRGAGGNGACENVPVDMDTDGVPAMMVSGTRCAGTDCDDNNRMVRPGLPETCGNRLDDDCDGMVDNPATCPVMTGGGTDTCVMPTAIVLTTGAAPMAVSGTTVGMVSNIASPCGGDGGGDVFFSVTWPANSDLRLDLAGMGGSADPVLIVRDSCASVSTLVCNDDWGRTAPAGLGSRVVVRSADPGASGTRTVIVAVDAYMRGAESPFTLTLSSSATSSATGTCSGGPFDISTGGTVLASQSTGHDFYSGSCGTSSGSDEVYQYRGPTGRIDVTANSGRTVVSYARAGACSSGGELVCQSNNPAAYNFNHTGANSYIFVDGLFSSTTNPNYTLRVLIP